MLTMTEFRRDRILAFVARHRLAEAGPGAYRYSLSVEKPTLYSSAYAAMALSLIGELDRLSEGERSAWIEYLNRHQDEDGLFRDPVISGRGWYEGDPLWCGRPHLTCHVINALACLGGVAPRPARFLAPWRNADSLVRWLESRDWAGRVGWTGNEVLNIGTLLQYERDFHGGSAEGKAVSVLLDWLCEHHVSPATGVWGALDVANPVWRSHAVQAAYHLWLLFSYDRRPVPSVERAIDTVLATQNPLGGFGWGVHNSGDPYRSSACEDIDSIDPLCRMAQLTDYRRADIESALARAADWVMTNQTADGGFGFMLDRPFEYGHSELKSAAGQGAMFPMWFRLLSLALIGRALPGHPLARVPWRFVRCPGMQFWTEPPPRPDQSGPPPQTASR